MDRPKYLISLRCATDQFSSALSLVMDRVIPKTRVLSTRVLEVQQINLVLHYLVMDWVPETRVLCIVYPSFWVFGSATDQFSSTATRHVFANPPECHIACRKLPDVVCQKLL